MTDLTSLRLRALPLFLLPVVLCSCFRAPVDGSHPADAGASAAVHPQCVEGSARCTGDLAERCDASGRWQVDDACDAPGTFCDDGRCEPCPSTGDVTYVDPSGRDEPGHGGGPGRCAFRTLTFALERAEGRISLGGDISAADTGETFPFVLRGRQHLACNGATLRGWGTYKTTTLTVVFEGSANGLSDCVVRAEGSTGYCVMVWTPTSPLQLGHVIERSEISHCGGAAVVVHDDGQVTFTGNRIHNSGTGIYWYGAGLGGTMSGNTFSTNKTVDIRCFEPAPSVTGSGNRRGASAALCEGCAHFPF